MSLVLLLKFLSFFDASRDVVESETSKAVCCGINLYFVNIEQVYSTLGDFFKLSDSAAINGQIFHVFVVKTCHTDTDLHELAHT